MKATSLGLALVPLPGSSLINLAAGHQQPSQQAREPHYLLVRVIKFFCCLPETELHHLAANHGSQQSIHPDNPHFCLHPEHL
jgi:hypothetical protein